LIQRETPTLYRYLAFTSAGGRLNVTGCTVEGGPVLRGGGPTGRPLIFGWKYSASRRAVDSGSSFEWTATKINAGGGIEGVTWILGFPHWLGALICLIPPFWWLVIRIRNRSAVAQGVCQKCGYDLRATPDRCPECGIVPTKS
jgi:hypothetical protein